MGIYKDCLKSRFHALLLWPVPTAARVLFSASQINIAGLPNVFAMVIFQTAEKRYCNIESNSPYSRFPGIFLSVIQKGVAVCQPLFFIFFQILFWLFFPSFSLRNLRQMSGQLLSSACSRIFVISLRLLTNDIPFSLSTEDNSSSTIRPSSAQRLS